MENFRRLDPEQLDRSAFRMINRDWLQVVTEANGRANSMTASWGGMGILWNKPVLYLVIRPQRFTRELLDENGHFSVCILDESYRKAGQYLGTASGRDEDKIANAGLILGHENGVPYLADAHTVFLCRTLYRQPMGGEFFLEKEDDQKHYPDKDYHILYVAEIEDLYIK